MSREIKTRENYKDIKVPDKSIHGMKRMRQASIRAKESNSQEQMQEQERHVHSPVAYAEDKAAYGTERAVREIPHQTRNAYRTAKASAKKTEQAMRKAKQTIKNTEKATKETAKAIVNVVKATFTATKSLISMIIAGGWVAVFILLIIVLFGAWFAIAGGDESEQMEVFSAEVLAYEPLIQQYADQHGMSEYVLVEVRWDEVMQELGFKGELLQRVSEATVKSDIWKEYDRSLLSYEEMLELFIANAPELEKEIRLFMRHEPETIRKFPYAREWVKSFRDNGYNCYILSNYPRYCYEKTYTERLYEEFINGAVYSCQVQLVKPETEIYQTLLKRYELIPEECVFLDDNLGNVDTARKLGIHAVQFTTKEECERELRKLGVKC